jgi:hypothetical protein
MSDVSTPSAAVNAMSEDWTLARALLGGTRAMREAGKKHLPKWPDEEEDAYLCRLASAVLFPAYSRTIETLTGKPFSKPITIGEDVPPQIREWLDDIDLQGRNLDMLAADTLQIALGMGLAGILVDYPTKGAEIRTVADERAAGLRPYAIQIYPWQVLGWLPKRVAGAWTLAQLRLLERVEVEDGPFGTKEIEQVRVLTPGAWETYRKNEKKEWVLYEKGVTSLKYIPFAPAYGTRLGFMMGKPPLVELAHMNVRHWQSQSDQDTILHVARVPILAVVGVDDDQWKMTIGASAAVRLPTGADMKYVEHSGAAIEAGKVSLDDLKEEMRQAGAELLVIKPGTVTATQHANENAVGMCALQRIAKGVEDTLDQMLQIFADWVGEKQGGHVTLFDDYAAHTMAEASMQIVATLPISDETKFEEAQRRGMISPDKTWLDERERLDAQGPALGTIPGGPANPITA